MPLVMPISTPNKFGVPCNDARTLYLNESGRVFGGLFREEHRDFAGGLDRHWRETP